MSRIAPTTPPARRSAPVAIEIGPAPGAPAGTIVIGWSIARTGLASPPASHSNGTPAGTAQANPGEAILELTIDPEGSLGAELRLCEGGPSVASPVLPPGARVRCVVEGDLLHLDSRPAGLLHATVRIRAGAPEVLYARTSLLGALGLRGGRYELRKPR